MENFTEAIFDAVHEDIVWKNGSQCCECDVRFEKGTLKEEFCLFILARNSNSGRIKTLIKLSSWLLNGAVIYFYWRKSVEGQTLNHIRPDLQSEQLQTEASKILVTAIKAGPSDPLLCCRCFLKDDASDPIIKPDFESNTFAHFIFCA